jgi:hypothetical protein
MEHRRLHTVTSHVADHDPRLSVGMHEEVMLDQ